MKIIVIAIVITSVFASATARQPIFEDNEVELSVARMAKVGFASSPTFSPDGSRIAFVTNISGLPQVWTMPVSGGYPRLITSFDDPVGFVTWSPDGKWLAFNLAPGGGFNEQIYVVRPDGTGLRRLTDGGKENNFLDGWSPDGRFIAFSSNRRDPSATDSYLIDVATGQSRMIAQNRGVGSIADVSRDGKYAIVNRLVNKDRDLTALARVRLGQDDQPGPIEVLAARNDGELAGAAMNEQGSQLALLWNIAGRVGSTGPRAGQRLDQSC